MKTSKKTLLKLKEIKSQLESIDYFTRIKAEISLMEISINMRVYEEMIIQKGNPQAVKKLIRHTLPKGITYYSFFETVNLIDCERELKEIKEQVSYLSRKFS